MQKIDNFTFVENGITIKFSKGKIDKTKFAFKVEGNDELTQKLISSVKNKEVMFSAFELCAGALFEIIKNNKFSVLMSIEEIRSLSEKFELEFGQEPYFDIEDLTTKNNPRFSARIINTDVPKSKLGEGRTKQEARGRALKNILANVPN